MRLGPHGFSFFYTVKKKYIKIAVKKFPKNLIDLAGIIRSKDATISKDTVKGTNLILLFLL